MGAARAKKPVGFGVSGGRPSSGRDEYTGWPRVFSPSQVRPSSCVTTSAGPVLARFLFTPYHLTDPIRGKSCVFPLGVAAGAGERGEEARSGVDGGRGGVESRCPLTTDCCLLDGTVLLVDGIRETHCQRNSTRSISKRGGRV